MANARKILLRRADGTFLDCQHGEAFSLMKYANEATGRVEWLWNTRDGVTPFGINDPMVSAEKVEAYRTASSAAAKSTKTYGAWLKDNPDPTMMRHADWGEDSFVPNFVPPIGMRVFFSYADAPEAVKADLASRWGERIEKAPPSHREGMKALAPFDIRDDGPVIATVDQAIHDLFLERARDNPFAPAGRAA